ncbi:MAG: hypothetical protein KGP29_05305 [Proteobacteria bacterium]|nr:hypothetical protein [Pseudomonadota bacterium]
MSDKEKAQDLFSVFMKKQAQAKKKEAEINSNTKKKPEKSRPKEQNQEEKTDSPEQEEMTEEEQLEDAKKSSRNKAAQIDQTEMIKKLLMEIIVKYSVLIALLVIFAFALINFGSSLLAAINGLFYKAFIAALKVK